MTKQRLPTPLLNVLANWGAFVWVAVVNFFLSPFIVHQLGDTVYGIWAIVGSVTGYLGLLDLGVRTTVTRYIARYAAQDDFEAINRLASSAMALFAGSGLLALILSLSLAAALPHLFHIPPDNLRAGQLAIALSGVTVAISLVSGVFGGTVIGLQRFTLVGRVDIALEALRLVAVWTALRNGGGLLHLASIHLGLAILRLVIYRSVTHRLLPRLVFTIKRIERSTISIILSFSGFAFLLHASNVLILYSDELVVGSLLPLTAVTFFAIGASLTEYARSVLSGISQTLSPMTSATEAGEHPEAVARLLQRSLRLGTLALLPILFTFLIRGPSFIALWMGDHYREQSGSVLMVLSGALCFAASYEIVTATMFGLNRHRSMAPVYLAEGAINVLLSILLAEPLGIIGVALGTALPRLAVSFWIGPRLAKRTLQIPAWTFAREAWIRPIAAMGPFAIASFALESLWPAPSLALYFAQVAASIPLAALGAWFVALDHVERNAVRAWLGRPVLE